MRNSNSFSRSGKFIPMRAAFPSSFTSSCQCRYLLQLTSRVWEGYLHSILVESHNYQVVRAALFLFNHKSYSCQLGRPSNDINYFGSQMQLTMISQWWVICIVVMTKEICSTGLHCNKEPDKRRSVQLNSLYILLWFGLWPCALWLPEL